MTDRVGDDFEQSESGVEHEASSHQCDVNGCEEPALAKVLPTYGDTDHVAHRCRDCLLYDLEREWFGEWRSKIEARE